MDASNLDGIKRLRKDLRTPRRWGRAVQQMELLYRLLAVLFARIRVLCPRCARPMDRDTIARGESVFWCPFCQTVEKIPLFRFPGWVAGVMAVLIIKCCGGI